MNTYGSSSTDKASRSIANHVYRHQGLKDVNIQALDHRPETAQMKRLRQQVDDSPRNQVLTQLHKIINGSSVGNSDFHQNTNGEEPFGKVGQRMVLQREPGHFDLQDVPAGHKGIVYRGGSMSENNFTPRPADVHGPQRGLSTFEDLGDIKGKARILDTNDFNFIEAHRNGHGDSHVSLLPPAMYGVAPEQDPTRMYSSDENLAQWALERDSKASKLFTADIRTEVQGAVNGTKA